jgi:hypothetical protein
LQWRCSVIVAATALLIAACASNDGNAQATFRETARGIARSLAAYEREPDGSCSSVHLQSARAGVEKARSWWGSDGTLARETRIGDMSVDIADAARRHGCPEVAREIYDDVIATYVGPRFTRLRQRAEQGIRQLSRPA